MKYTILFAIFLQLSISMAQDTADNKEDKPSWSEDLPEMIDTPDLNIESNVDTNIDFGELGLNREDLFSDSEETAVKAEVDLDTSNVQNDANDNDAAKEKAEAELLARENAAKEKAEAELLAREKAAKEKAEAELLARENAAKQKAELESIAQEKETQVQASASGSQQTKKNRATYQWKNLVNATPRYPSRAARTGLEGWVDVETEIDVDGNVINSKVVKSSANSNIFHRAALNAANKWKFEPPSDFGIEENQFQIFKVVFEL